MNYRVKVILGVMILLLVVLSIPNASFGLTLVPDCNTKFDSRTGKITNPCTFSSAIELIRNIIDYIILISAPIAAVMFSYAGWLYISASGNLGQISKAHSVFWTVFVGFIVILAAWLIIKSISILIAPGFSLLE